MPVKPLRAIPAKQVSIDVPLIGWVCGYDPERGLLVDFSQNQTQEPVPARWIMQLDRTTLEQAVQQKQQVVLVFEDGDALLPIVTGLVQPLQLREAAPAARVELPGSPTEARVDGKRLTFEAADEIVLRCGPASITLRRNGAVVIRGAHVVSHSSGMNRIRGGAVHIN